MIYGIGTDLCDVGRIEKSIARPAFLQHVYTPAEQELIGAHTGKKQAETAAALLEEEMENVVQLSVPLTAEAHWGRNWLEAKG